MSHYVALVIVNCEKEDMDGIRSCVDNLLEPYNENTRVAEYEQNCFCIGSIAHKEAEAQTNAEVGTIESLREKYHKYVDLLIEAKFIGKKESEISAEEKEKQRQLILRTNKNWKYWLTSRENMFQAFLSVHPLKNAPDPKCSECKGTGKYKTTCNPKSQWDWWEIGGRWKGQLQGQDVMRIADLKKSFYPYALVTPDGEWHERGMVGWFGFVANEQSTRKWRNIVRQLLAQYNDRRYVGVLCDLHI